MKKIAILRNIVIIFIIMQIIAFIIVKQRFAELQRKTSKLENEISERINQNNLLKIKLTSLQNDYRIRKLGERYLPEYKSFKPNQIIEVQNI